MTIGCRTYREEDEWSGWKKITDPILHIELRNWADIMVIAPLDANTLGKIANGLCDNLLTCVLRAWDVNKPVIACPAMNTSMWHHPLTSRHLEILENVLKYNIIQPISKKLACGDTGLGAMAESRYIADYVLEMINGKGLAGLTVEDSMKAVFDCSADEAGELSFKEGDILVDVEESGEEGWYTGRIQNTVETGLFPYNYVVEIPAAQSQSNVDEKPISKFPPIDAFETAMSAGKTSKSSNTNNWTSFTANSIPSPLAADSKPKLPAASSISSNNTIGLGIKLHGNSVITSTFEKPKLKPIGNIKSTESSLTRSRSYSTSAISNEAEKEPIQAEKTIKPSQLLNGKATKSALELALSKGSPKASSSNLKSNNTFSKSNTVGIALPGMSSIKPSSSNNNNDLEEEDGFQMIKPSQLRQKQTSAPTIRPFASQSTSYTTSTTPSWKRTAETKTYGSTSGGNKSGSPSFVSSSKLDVAPSSSPMPRLPSRPTSAASRRSRNSRISSSSPLSSSSLNSSPNANLTAVRETNEKSAPPPILKPKPQINSTTATQPVLPPRPKLRSTSNPPPIQPKPAMSSIEMLLSKSNKNDSIYTATATPNVSSKPTTTPPPRNAATKPVVPSAKPTTGAKLTTRPNLDSWKSADNAKDQLDNANIKPSVVLKNNRARSATNPVSSPSSTAPPEWMAALKPEAPTITKPVLYERPTSPIAHPVSRSPASTAAAAVKIEPAKKKANPPPPPPSRPPKSKNIASDSHSKKKQRYEVLFESIHDDGYVDGETAHFVWLKSKLSNEDLARIWKECDPDHKGLLDKHAFIDGMSKIDELLSLKQLQQHQVI
ncbi:hypothetical protein [Parasitella parasitica]|uniref:SH3 domain-containing protein n=1 Tax=Parasitella parasitica TaxID=35722 RepID=A0A0B7NWA8_9FUNG|nr:hypothetical protein [Parasitella parasitica]